MTFWTEANLEPTRKFRFNINTPGSSLLQDGWWWATSVDKPAYDVSVSEYQLINHKFKFPGILSWSDITIKVVDPLGNTAKSITSRLMKNLGVTYKPPSESATTRNLFAKTPVQIGNQPTIINQVIIEQLAASGAPIETWTLHSAFVKSVTFGDLAYADDGLVEIDIGISYDFATFKSEGR